MKSRVFAIVLAVALLLSVIPSMYALEKEEGYTVPQKEDYHLFPEFDPTTLEQQVEKGYTFVIYEGEAIILSAGEEVLEKTPVESFLPQFGYKTSVTVPAELGGAPVTALWDKCFYSLLCGTVSLPDSIRWIGDRVFEKAYEATFETLPASLEYVGDYAFEQAVINEETLPEGLRFIGDFSFQICRFQRLSFGENLEYIGKLAFYNAKFEELEITLPESLRYAGDYMFCDFIDQTSLRLTVLSKELICDNAFEYVESVTGHSGSTVEAVCGKEGIPFYSLETGDLYDPTYEKTVDNIVYRITADHGEVVGTEGASEMQYLIIADHIDGKPVTVIKKHAIGGHDVAQLEILILPDTVREMERIAIYNCEKLYYIRMSNNLVRAEEAMIYGCRSLLFLYMPISFTEYILYDDTYDDGLFSFYTHPWIAAHPGSFAYKLCKAHSSAVLSAREGYTYLGDKHGIYETDGVSARYLAMVSYGGSSYYDPFIFPDSAFGIPVTTIAGDLRYNQSITGYFGHKVAVLGDNITVVEEGAFSRSDLRYIYFGPNVKELPYPLISEQMAKYDHAICGYAGSYVEEYCKQYGYSFYPVDSAPFEDVSLKDWFNDAVSYCYWSGLMSGVSKDRFAPNAVTNRAMVAQVLYNLSGKPYIYEWEYGFKDVHEEDWFCDAVNWCSYYGITKGTDKYHFSPKDPVTREQLVTLFYRYGQACKLDLTERAKLDAFKDRNSVSAYAQEAMQWAVGAGIIYGRSASTLAPKGHATRAEIAAILMRFVEYVEALGA